MRSLGAQQYSRLPCMLPHRGALVVECKAPADNSCDCPCRGLLDATVRSMILAPGNGAEEVKGIIPVAQWQKVVSILVSLVDCVELPSLAATACEDCQVGEAVLIVAAFLILFNIRMRYYNHGIVIVIVIIIIVMITPSLPKEAKVRLRVWSKHFLLQVRARRSRVAIFRWCLGRSLSSACAGCAG